MAYVQGELQCHGDLEHLADTAAFTDWLKPLRQVEWVVYSKRPFAGPEAVLSYLSRLPIGWRSATAAFSGSTTRV